MKNFYRLLIVVNSIASLSAAYTDLTPRTANAASIAPYMRIRHKEINYFAPYAIVTLEDLPENKKILDDSCIFAKSFFGPPCYEQTTSFNPLQKVLCFPINNYLLKKLIQNTYQLNFLYGIIAHFSNYDTHSNFFSNVEIKTDHSFFSAMQHADYFYTCLHRQGITINSKTPSRDEIAHNIDIETPDTKAHTLFGCRVHENTYSIPGSLFAETLLHNCIFFHQQGGSFAINNLHNPIVKVAALLAQKTITPKNQERILDKLLDIMHQFQKNNP